MGKEPRAEEAIPRGVDFNVIHREWDSHGVLNRGVTLLIRLGRKVVVWRLKVRNTTIAGPSWRWGAGFQVEPWR